MVFSSISVFALATQEKPNRSEVSQEKVAVTAYAKGEVAADEVYVRSGPSTDYYPVIKLHTGDQVTIVKKEFDWVEILPPKEAFSLISDEYVDSWDKLIGVVNGNNVRIRAGSLLVKDKSKVQTHLSKGAKVKIVGHTEDGYYKIEPPPGTTLWVSAKYVRMVQSKKVAGQHDLKPGDAVGIPVDSLHLPPTGDKSEGGPTKPARVDVFKGLRPSKQLDALKKIEVDFHTELAKPAFERNLDPLIKRYQTVANSEGDTFAKRYATARLSQLEQMEKLLTAARKIRALNASIDSTRKASLEQSTESNFSLPTVPTKSGFDVQGELQRSAIYASHLVPQRYRLVDPTTTPPRTVAYIELPPGSTIAIEDFIGRYVGVRALKKRLQPGMVSPVPLYTAAQIVPLKNGG